MFTVVWIDTTRSTLISGITLFITFVSLKPKVIFWVSLVVSTAFRFTTNAACLLFVDSIRELVKFSPITVLQFLQYNTTFTHNPFLSVIEILTHSLEQNYKLFLLKNYKRNLCEPEWFHHFYLHQLGWLVFFSLLSFQGLLYHCQFCICFFFFIETYLAFGACHLIQCAFSKQKLNI